MFPTPRPTPLVLTLCLLLAGWVLRAPEGFALQEPPASEEYILRVWDGSDGLPNNHVSGLAQTPDGYVWIATWWGGLVRFDGVDFTPISISTNPQTDANRVHTVFVSRDGTLWVGMERGAVVRRRNGQFEMIVPPAPATESTVTVSSFAEDASGAIWFAYAPDEKIFRLAGDKLTCFSVNEGLTAGREPYVCSDVNGKIWFSAHNGCGVFENERFHVVDIEGSGGRITAAPREGIWALVGPSLLHYHNDGSKETVAHFPWLETEGGIYVLYSDREGNLWIGSRSKGLFRFRDGSVTKVPTSHSAIISILEDREGDLLVGTEAGLNRLQSSAFSMRQIKHGLLNDSIVSLCLDAEGRLWLASRTGSVVRAVDASNHFFSVPEGWSSGAVMAMYADSQGGVWFGLLGDLILWRDGTFSRQKLFDRFTAIQKDQEGGLWVSSINGPLFHRLGEMTEKIPTEGGLVLPRALAVDPSGSVWVGTEAGRVFRRVNSQFLPVQLPNAKPGEIIRFIVPDGKETVWIGSFRGGLYRWRNGQVLRLDQDAGLPQSDLRSLIIDPEGDLWFGAGQGLFRVPRTQLEAVLEGGKASLHCACYSRNEGVPTAEFSFGFRGATARTADGHLWFATYSGALEVDPQRLRQPVVSVPVLIEGLLCSGSFFSCPPQAPPLASQELRPPRSPSVPGAISFPPQPGPIQIQFTQPQLSAPSQVRFRYRLMEGRETPDWIDGGTQRIATFARLTPGQYRFEVESSDVAGEWSGRTASVQFAIRAAWWETKWFRFSVAAIAAVGLISLARWVVKRRMRARIRKLEQANALDRERIRIARDIHDELGANLTQISLASKLIDLDSSQGGSEHAKTIASIARKTVESLDEIVWAVNPRHDSLESLIHYLRKFALRFLGEAGIECDARVPEKLPQTPLAAQVRHHLFVSVKEVINNIAKHSAATRVTLEVKIGGGDLSIAVSDNGVGFNLEQALNDEDPDGNGLLNMRSRMAEIHGACHIESQPGKGTQIRFELPLTA